MHDFDAIDAEGLDLQRTIGKYAEAWPTRGGEVDTVVVGRWHPQPVDDEHVTIVARKVLLEGTNNQGRPWHTVFVQKRVGVGRTGRVRFTGVGYEKSRSWGRMPR